MSHYGEDLLHVLEISFDCVLVEGCTAYIQISHVNAACKYLEIGDWIRSDGKIWIKGDPGAEIEPLL